MISEAVPGEKRFLMMNISVQHNALSKAIKSRFKNKNIYDVTSHWALIFIMKYQKTYHGTAM